MTNLNQQLEVLADLRLKLKVQVASAAAMVSAKARKFHAEVSGATTLEYGLLLASIGIPSYFIIHNTLLFLLDYYQMMTAVNALPFP